MLQNGNKNSNYRTNIICPIIVAIAAPLTPKLKIKIAIGSKTMFNNAPIKVANMANFGEPSALIIPFNPAVIIENGIPINII